MGMQVLGQSLRASAFSETLTGGVWLWGAAWPMELSDTFGDSQATKHQRVQKLRKVSMAFLRLQALNLSQNRDLERCDGILLLYCIFIR